ncbi:MAG TPA: type II secretion system F family protein [Thermoleophilaceae bacterium]|nr:type II secretion system F family protein [Thermoleophilaceae bacterium]
MTGASVLAFMAAVLAVTGLADVLGSARPHRRAEGRSAEGRSAARLLRALARLGRRLKPAGAPAPRDLEARIAAAGRPGGLGAREVMAAKVAAAVGGGLLAALLSAAAPGRLGIALAVAGPAAGFLAPDAWLARRAAHRARRVRAELPALLDLLRVSVEAGSSLPKALREVGARTRGPLAAEWRALGREVALGVPLEAALGGTVDRLPLPEVRSLVAALERARRHGAPLADTLASQARDARFALARHAREEAARAGPKIQLVVALLLVPSVLLLVAAALVAALLDGGGAALPV